MDTFKYIILKILITCSVCISAFVIVYKNGFCLADPVLSESALESFQSLNGGMGATNYYGLNAQGYDPLSIFILGAGGDMIDKTNQYLEQNYDFDLSEMGFAMNDMIETASWNEGTADGMINRLTKGAYQNLGSAVQNGVNFLASKVLVGGMAAKMFLMGAVDSATNTITSVFGNNAYVKLSDEYIDNMSNIASDLVSQGDIANYSSLNAFFSKTVEFTNDTYHWVIKTDKPLIYYKYEGQNQIYIVKPYSDYSVSISATRVRISDGSYETFNSWSISSSNGTFNVNGVRYTYGGLLINGGPVISTRNLWDVYAVMQFIEDYNPFLTEDYSYNYSNSQNMAALFNLLKNKWVTTDDLAQINTKLNELTLGNIDINGNNSYVIDTDSQSLGYQDLYDLIQQILQNNAFINNDTNFDTENSQLTDPLPEPDPVQNINQGIDIPTGFDNSFLNPFVDVIKLPFKFFTIFSPVFAIFGNSALLTLWLFFPSFLIIMIIIWCLK